MMMALFLLQTLLPARARVVATKPPAAKAQRITTTVQTHVATFHFAGLVLFTTRDVAARNTVGADRYSEQPQVIAIMPWVREDPMQATARLESTHRMIEIHTPVIAFKPADLVPGSMTGWTESTLRQDLHYIHLTGDHITFVADGVNRTAALDPLVPHVGGHQLRPEYESAPGAAAVFEIPYGKLLGCASGAANGRIDTTLTLSNHGTITIKGDGGKSVTFKGDATIWPANMPMSWLINKTALDAGSPHYMIYCEMTGAVPCPAPATSGIPMCSGDDTLVMRPPAGRSKGGVATTQSADVFCSNSQWP
jgi:hypothetical protein